MARGRDPEALLEEKRTICADQQKELTRLRSELADAYAQIADRDERIFQGDRVVRWLLRDQEISQLRLEVTPGSAFDLSMMERLVQIMAVVDADRITTAARYYGEAAPAEIAPQVAVGALVVDNI